MRPRRWRPGRSATRTRPSWPRWQKHAAELAELVTAHRPRLLAEHGCGALTAAILIGHTAGNERFRSDAAFALQTGTAPIPCSSGKRTQHRLNRGGNRQANAALYRVVIVRMRAHQPTLDYVKRRTVEGKSKPEIIRCLKRFVAREIFGYLCRPADTQHTVISSA